MYTAACQNREGERRRVWIYGKVNTLITCVDVIVSGKKYPKETDRWTVTDVQRSLLSTWCQGHSGICRLQLCWQCTCCCLGDQADIWGFWPGARLRHPYSGGRRGGGRPEDHLPRVSDTIPIFFPLITLLFSNFDLLLVFSFHFPLLLMRTLVYSPLLIPCSGAASLSFPFTLQPFSHSCAIFLLFHHHRWGCSSAWKVAAAPPCKSSLVLMLKTKITALCISFANCILIPLMEVAIADAP